MNELIIKALGDGRELRLSAIAERIGCGRDETGSYLQDLRRWGMVTTTRPRSRYWRLTTWVERDQIGAGITKGEVGR